MKNTRSRITQGSFSKGTLGVSTSQFRALLIGECPNTSPEYWDQIAAFVPFPLSGSGAWLRKTLGHPLLSNWHFTFENAVTLDRVMPKFYTFNAVVALSKTVAYAYDLPYVPHPAYWRRFYSGRPDVWIALLLQELALCLQKRRLF